MHPAKIEQAIKAILQMMRSCRLGGRAGCVQVCAAMKFMIFELFNFGNGYRF